MQDERDLPDVIETTKGKDGTYKHLKKEVSLKGSMAFIVSFGTLMWMQMNGFSKESIFASIVIGTIGGTMEWAYWRKRAKLHKMQAEKQEISERDQIYIKTLSKLDRVVIHLEHYFCWYILGGFFLYLVLGGLFLAGPAGAY